MTTIAVNTTDTLTPLRVTCGCPSGRRVLPIRMARDVVRLMSEYSLGPDKLLFTYRCGDCGYVVQVRVRHMQASC